MKPETVVKKLKTEAARQNKRRAKERAVHGPSKWNEPVDFRSVLSLDWQVKNERFKGCNGKVTFDPASLEAHSYSHWLFVRRIKGKVVFNAYRYSVTTSGHQASVRSLLKALGIRIDLEVKTHASLSNFESKALPVLYGEYCETLIASKRRGAKDRSGELKDLQRAMKLARKLGARITADDKARIERECADAESQRLADLASKRARQREIAQASRVMVRTSEVADLTALQ